MIYQEEFQRFESPLVHTITFSDCGTIISANLWSDEIAKQYPDGVTLHLPLTDFWQQKIYQWLDDRHKNELEKKYWDQSKAGNG